jgi:kynureninase
MSDPLVAWRREFPILGTCTYLVSHSLGAMPRRAAAYLQQFADEWSSRGVRAWHEGWWEIGTVTGSLLAPILGVQPGSISMHQNVTVAQAVVASCHRFDGRRRRVVIADHDFPTNMYLFEGFRQYGAEIVYVRSDDAVRTSLERLLDALDERTALVSVSLVLFKSAYVENAAAIVEKAHRVGARVVLDVYQAAGTLPLNLETLAVDFAVGGSVKWLCGGPGAAYLYVRPDLAREIVPGLAGWAAHADPFAFEPGPLRPGDPPWRFQTGTPNVPALYSCRAGYEIVREIGVEAIRARSLSLTRLIMNRAKAAGFRINTPERDEDRGGTVIVDVADGAAVAEALIAKGVIVDHRPGAGIRIAPHFYNTAEEIEHALDVLIEAALDSRSRRAESRPDPGSRPDAGSRIPDPDTIHPT